MAADIEAMGLSLRDDGACEDERCLGERVLEILKRLRNLGELSPRRAVPQPVPPDLDLAGLLERWPESPCLGRKDLLHRALLEFHKSRRGSGRARRRGVSALVDLAVHTAWNPYHPWRLVLLERARDFAPDVADVHFQIARHLKAYGEMAAARRACRRAVALDPRAPEPLVLLAGFLEFCVRPREALDVYERVLRLRDRFGYEGLGGKPGGRERGGARRSLSGSFRLTEVSLRKAALAALDGCARLRPLLGRHQESVRAMAQLVRESPGETRQLRGLYALAHWAGADRVLVGLARELELRGGTPGGILPAGFEDVDPRAMARWLREEVGYSV